MNRWPLVEAISVRLLCHSTSVTSSRLSDLVDVVGLVVEDEQVRKVLERFQRSASEVRAVEGVERVPWLVPGVTGKKLSTASSASMSVAWRVRRRRRSPGLRRRPAGASS